MKKFWKWKNQMTPAERTLFLNGTIAEESWFERYAVVTPLADTFELHADNAPEYETQEAMISLFSRNNYTKLKNALVRSLLNSDFTVTNRRYNGYENDTGYHHYIIDLAKIYGLEE